MRILPNIGLDEVRFGMQREQVLVLLGEPEQREQDRGVGYETEAWYYWADGISVHFDADVDWRLTTIEVSSEDARLVDSYPVGMSRPQLRALLAGLTVDWSGDEMEPIRVLEWDMDIYFEDEELGQVQWSVPLGEDDCEIWPE